MKVIEPIKIKPFVYFLFRALSYVRLVQEYDYISVCPNIENITELRSMVKTIKSLTQKKGLMDNYSFTLQVAHYFYKEGKLKKEIISHKLDIPTNNISFFFDYLDLYLETRKNFLEEVVSGAELENTMFLSFFDKRYHQYLIFE